MLVSQLMFVASCIFWGVIVLSILVFAHEAGHYLAARACGVRVTEFFLGLPSRLRISHRSRKHGTEIGVTPVLLGGYTRICGMGESDEKNLAPVLGAVQQGGRVSVESIAQSVGCTTDEAYAALETLADWAAVEPYYDPELGEQPNQKNWPVAFQTARRDADMLTCYDREHDFSRPGSTEAGEPRPVSDPAVLLESERSRTYLGKGTLPRLAMLFGGPLASFVTGALLVVLAMSVLGSTQPVDSNILGEVADGSPAQSAGLVAGDEITSFGGHEVTSFTTLAQAIDDVAKAGGNAAVTYVRDGKTCEATVTLGSDGKLGVYAPTQVVRISLVDSLRFTLEYSGQVAQFALKLITPAHTMEVVSESSSVVGISVMASQAAAGGLVNLVMLMAAVSLSLAFMNLLPIPPLDGGKIVIELVQAALGRQLSLRVQSALTYVGLGLFLLLFVVVLRQDILRLVIG